MKRQFIKREIIWGCNVVGCACNQGNLSKTSFLFIFEKHFFIIEKGHVDAVFSCEKRETCVFCGLIDVQA